MRKRHTYVRYLASPSRIFQPQPGAPIESFAQGEHTAIVRYWKILDGEAKYRTYVWRFLTD